MTGEYVYGFALFLASGIGLRIPSIGRGVFVMRARVGFCRYLYFFALAGCQLTRCFVLALNSLNSSLASACGCECIPEREREEKQPSPA